jgi:NAD(P)-dependent dehydrogenase (short-subunit alcohol dehydrogenase family)
VADLAGGPLSGTTALITGASSGIGRQLAEGLGARGMAVAGLARNGERLAAAMAEVAGSTGARTLAVPADVTDRASVDEAVARVREELGPVDLLVNNAGVIDAAEEPLWEVDPDSGGRSWRATSAARSCSPAPSSPGWCCATEAASSTSPAG